jgi:hypothetical protein
MTQRLMIALFVAFCSTDVSAESTHWVTSDELARRTCSSTQCGVVGKLYFREGAEVLEQKAGWARISKYYDASCKSGHSEYVDEGNSTCTPTNGISDGKFAEWVLMKHLSKTRPEKKSQAGIPPELLDSRITGVPDVGEYALTLEDVVTIRKYAKNLLDSGTCSKIEYGNKSPTKKDTYFVLCADENSNRFFQK